MGCQIQNGQLVFDVSLLKVSEFLNEENIFTYIDVDQTFQSIPLKKHQLVFTYCQVPIVYTLCEYNWRHIITSKDGTKKEYDGNIVKQNISGDLFSRSGQIKQINVNCPKSSFLF